MFNRKAKRYKDLAKFFIEKHFEKTSEKELKKQGLRSMVYGKRFDNIDIITYDIYNKMFQFEILSKKPRKLKLLNVYTNGDLYIDIYK